MNFPGDIACCENTVPFRSLWGGNLTEAVRNGTVKASRVRDMGVRILAGYFKLNQDSDAYPTPNFYSWDLTSE